MKIIVTDDYLPGLSTIQLNSLCKDWKMARDNGTEKHLHHRYLGYAHLALADGMKRDADDYFTLADVLEY